MVKSQSENPAREFAEFADKVDREMTGENRPLNEGHEGTDFEICCVKVIALAVIVRVLINYNNLSIHSSMHTFVHPSFHATIHQSVSPPTHPSFNEITHLSI